ncbi:guanylate kinase [Niveomyces insectorum RCEF 264]|uniref:Guanylate kinase n=1 Tax=Niveomyces insectorum RCEF 264 TaxID=1081102 RepID=A0A167NSF2_9HYPO|nr:guanylate kinase [Niveomyces insectorum RCEF 264]
MAVSHTTRSPRPGEIHGESYYYVSRDEFVRLIGDDAFIEHAGFNGNLYGTSKQTVIDQAAKGSIVVLDIEMEGVKQLKKVISKQEHVNYRFVFIQPPGLRYARISLARAGHRRRSECAAAAHTSTRRDCLLGDPWRA